MRHLGKRIPVVKIDIEREVWVILKEIKKEYNHRSLSKVIESLLKEVYKKETNTTYLDKFMGAK